MSLYLFTQTIGIYENQNTNGVVYCEFSSKSFLMRSVKTQRICIKELYIFGNFINRGRYRIKLIVFHCYSWKEKEADIFV